MVVLELTTWYSTPRATIAEEVLVLSSMDAEAAAPVPRSIVADPPAAHALMKLETTSPQNPKINSLDDDRVPLAPAVQVPAADESLLPTNLSTVPVRLFLVMSNAPQTTWSVDEVDVQVIVCAPPVTTGHSAALIDPTAA
jgi:hypothetical protein